jgi:rare lipoprotein A
MPDFALLRVLPPLILVASATAAHPEASAPAPVASSFESNFAPFSKLPPAAVPSAGAVDLATIEHKHGEAEPADAGKPLGTGVASYYGREFDGRRTASGERFDMSSLTAAHRTLPFGSQVRVTNPNNGRSVVVRINDRGPFHGGRVIDVSHAAAKRLGLIAPGKAKVSLTLLD